MLFQFPPFVDISIHALRKESDVLTTEDFFFCWDISIHALRKESDEVFRVTAGLGAISIHALRKESDAATGTLDVQPGYFNPRSP